MRKTKIVATIGPASSGGARLRQMIRAGLNVVRINGSHATHQQIREITRRIRRLSEELDTPVGVLLDLSGPKIRVGAMEDGGQPLRVGEQLSIQVDDVLGSSSLVSCTYKNLAKDVAVGDQILLDDGLLELKVSGIETDGTVHTIVVVGGELRSRKGINLPGAVVSIPALTDKDRKDLKVGIEMQVDYLALSFVQTADDVRELMAEIEHLGSDRPWVISKIEKPQAIDNLDEILEVTDGIMVARGDLGVEAGAEKVPLLQKQMILAANKRGRFSITATQMLDSMIRNPRPTRAEVSDVANAILDGSDAVMLSGETAMGEHPVEAIEMMKTIAEEVEAFGHDYTPHYGTYSATHLGRRLLSICRAGAEIGREPESPHRAMFAFTLNGNTALALSRYFPLQPIYGYTPKARTFQRLCILRGVYPVRMEFEERTHQLMRSAERIAMARGLLDPGQEAIVIGGHNEQLGIRNALRLMTVEDSHTP